MSEINTVSLINQMRLMAAKAEGGSVENAANPTQFTGVFQKALSDVSNLQLNTDNLRADYDQGKDVSVAEVMVATQKSTLGFEATLQIRNKLLQAYQDIMNMPI